MMLATALLPSSLFQSALALSGEGNGVIDHAKQQQPVSIRPRPFGRGEHGPPGKLEEDDNVSIRPRPFGRGEPREGGGVMRAKLLQSALALSGEGNSLTRSGRVASMCGFNPPSPFRARGTRDRIAEWVTAWRVSIRPRPFGRGEPGMWWGRSIA